MKKPNLLFRNSRLSDLLDVQVPKEAIDEVWEGIGRKRQHNLWPFGIAFAFAGVLAAVTMIVLWTTRAPSAHRIASSIHMQTTQESLPAVLVSDSLAQFDDGSRIEIDRGAVLRNHPRGPSRVAFDVEQGGAWFDVQPGGPRTWTVQVEDLRVTVIGTRFRVEKSADALRVIVERGHVRVSSPRMAETRELLAGDHVELPRLSASAPNAARVAVADADVAGSADAGAHETGTHASGAASETAAATGVAAVRENWREPAGQGDYGKAYAELGHQGMESETQRQANIDDLLMLADVARLSGHPRDALVPLEKILALYPNEPRAQVAAFTFGKLQLDVAGNPARAYDAFDAALRKGLPGALREDAMERRAEAAAKLGDAAKLSAAKDAYRTEFSQGRHRAQVDAW